MMGSSHLVDAIVTSYVMRNLVGSVEPLEAGQACSLATMELATVSPTVVN
jgi:hypothetical protein